MNEARSAAYRVSDYLRGPDDVREYLNAALEDGDERVLLRALRTVAESTGGIAQLAKQTGLAPKSLQRALVDDGNPRLSNVLAILKALGLGLTVRQRQDAA